MTAWRVVLAVAVALTFVGVFSLGITLGHRDASRFTSTCSHGIRVWNSGGGGLAVFPDPDCPGR